MLLRPVNGLVTWLTCALGQAALRIQALIEGTPAELAGCRLIFAEKTFSTDQPIHLMARVDRAYETETGLVLLELKRRYAGRVYAMDIIELSTQRIVIQRQSGMAVRNYGYVLLQQPWSGRKTLRHVDLLTEAEVLHIAKRRSQILAGALPPRAASNSACCTRCEYQHECTMQRL